MGWEGLWRVDGLALPLENVAADGDSQRLAKATEEGKHRNGESQVFGLGSCLELRLQSWEEPELHGQPGTQLEDNTCRALTCQDQHRRSSP